MQSAHLSSTLGRALLSAPVLALLVACSAAPEEDGSWSSGEELEGELVVYGGVQRDGSKVVRYALKQGKTEVPLRFDQAPALRPGSRLRVRSGDASRHEVRVIDYDMVEPEPGLGRVQQGLTALGEPQTRRTAVIMVHWGQPDGATPEAIHADLTTSENSATALFDESSYGKLALESDVFGWFQISEPTGCNVGNMALEGEAAARAAGIDVDSYDHLLFYFPGRSDCWFGGLGEVGTPATPARRTWYNGWHAPFVLSHELGHNLGFWHSHSYACGSTVAAPAACTSEEYGDPFDPMGNGLTQFNAYHKAAQGWLEGCSMVTAGGDGVFTLAPIELASTGAQALRVPLAPELCPIYPGDDCYYYVEYRQPLGQFDGVEPYQSSPMHEGVLVHIDSGIDTTGSSGLIGPYLLDMTPNSDHAFGPFWDASLSAGRSFQDQYGVRLRVLSQTPEAVRVAVDVPGENGAITCLDGSPTSGDAECSDGAQNGSETDVDCGGSCAPCHEGRVCSADADCWDGLCADGACVVPEPACDDGLLNGDESDVDCGGSCEPCGNNRSCNVPTDCQSNVCADGRCDENQLSGVLTVHSVWQEGYCGQLQLQNNGWAPTSSWSAEVRFGDSTLTSLSGAVATPVGDGRTQLTPESWNSTIWPSSHATVSFCAQITGPNYYPELLYVAGG